MLKEMICVACPIGCGMSIELDDEGAVLTVTGNQCKRGEAYAVTECTAPTRTLTTTAKVKNGNSPLVPVRSAKPLPKALLLDCMGVINAIRVDAPVKIGDVVLENILDTGVNIIATNSCSLRY